MKTGMRRKSITWMGPGLLLASLAIAQEPAASPNPLARNEQAIALGREIFNHSCTGCHGLNGEAGGRGPALGAGRSYVLRTDQSIFGAIQKGIPGTQMPPSGLETMDIWRVVTYIRSLRNTASDAFVPGSVANGEVVFWNKGQCGSCHMIRGRGGVVGPDLSNLGGERTLVYIRDALSKPRQPIPVGYQPIEVTTKEGRRISGIAKNADNFSVQLLDPNNRLQLFTSDELSQLTYKERSVMPSNYDKTLAAGELQDLIAFLSHQVTHKVEERRR
jgi:putative heme-binding domain-containing protein